MMIDIDKLEQHMMLTDPTDVRKEMEIEGLLAELRKLKASEVKTIIIAVELNAPHRDDSFSVLAGYRQDLVTAMGALIETALKKLRVK